MAERFHRCVGLWLALCIACAISCGSDDDAAEPGRKDAAVSCVPTGEEVCDSEHVDEDCDPSTLGVLDRDDDGVSDARCCNTDPTGVTRCGGDCHDLAAGVHPDADEVCDGSRCAPALSRAQKRHSTSYVAIRRTIFSFGAYSH